jgi:predicted transcriptional regulator
VAAPVRKKAAAEAVKLKIAAGASAAEAAREVGVSERSVRRWCADPNFAGEVGQLRAELVGQALGQLAHALTRAVATLAELLDDESSMARLGAARALLTSTLAYREAVSIEERLQALETHMPRRGR